MGLQLIGRPWRGNKRFLLIAAVALLAVGSFGALSGCRGIGKDTLITHPEYYQYAFGIYLTMTYYVDRFNDTAVELAAGELSEEEARKRINELRLAYDEDALMFKKESSIIPGDRSVRAFHRKLIGVMENSLRPYGLAESALSSSLDNSYPLADAAKEMARIERDVYRIRQALSN